MEPQRKGMAVGSGGFQACPNFWHVVLFEDAGQLSKALGVILKAKAHLLPSVRSSACTLFLATSRPSTGTGVNDQWISRWSSFLVSFRFLYFGYWPLFARIWLFEDVRHWRHACMRAFLLDRFCAGYDSASQAGGGTEEPIYSQALLLEPRHGLPPPLPQIALRFAAQINLEGQEKIQATALRAVLGRRTAAWLQKESPDTRSVSGDLNRSQLTASAQPWPLLS